SLMLSVGVAAANVLGIFWGGWLLTGANKLTFTLHSVKDYLQLIVFGGFLAGGLISLLGSGVYLLSGQLSSETYLHHMMFGWMGDALSIIVITPFVLLCSHFSVSAVLNYLRKAEILLMLGLTLLLGQVVFFDGFLGSLAKEVKGYSLFPFIAWLAIRLELPMISLVLLIVAIQGVLSIHLGVGYFVTATSLQNQLSNYWFYMLILSLVGMRLGIYIAERKQIEAALLDSQNHFRTLVNNTSILVWISGLNKRCYYFNQVWLTFTGRTLSQEIGDGWLDGIHQDDLRHYLDTYMAAFDARKAFTIEYRLKCADGRHHWMLDHGAPRYDENGTFLGFIGTLVDISSRKYAEKALSLRTKELTLQNTLLKQISSGISLAQLLAELARQVEALLSGALCSICLVDEEGQYLLHGASPSLPAFYQKSVHGILIDDEGGCGAAVYRGERVIVADIKQHPSVASFQGLAGLGIQSCWSEPIINKSGRVLGAFTIHYRQAKRPSVAEIALLERYANLAELIIEHKQSEVALQESEERLRFVLEGSELGLWDWQIKQNVVQRNAIWAEILGYKENEIKNTVQQWLDLVHPEDKKAALQSIKNVLSGRSDIHEIEYRMIHKDGSLKWVHDHAKVVQHDVNGRPVRMSGTQADITKIKQAEEELRIAAIAFESQEGMFVTDTQCVILRVNKSFTKITGYTESDTLGHTPRLFQSGLQNAGFYQVMWEQLHRTGEWQGEIWNRRKNDEIYPAWLTITAVKANNAKVSHYVATLTDITTRKLAEEKIAKLAFYDALTHLPNRRLLMEHLEHCIAVSKRDGKQMAVLMLDLDRFKAVNDSLGHQAGDELLQQVAKRLSLRLRDADMVARLGGDEFIVLLADIKNREDAGQVAENIVEDLSASFHLLQGSDVRIGVSIGISLCPQHSEMSDSLMEQADIALYQAKNKGRGQFEYFSGNLVSTAHDRLVMEKRLSRAIEHQELHLVYQAQVEINTNKIIGAEVLLRWKNSIDGFTPLHRFIPIAEESGLILNIGEWVLREACRQGRLWLDQGLPPLSLSVNLSPLQFRQTEISPLIASILAETAYPAEYLMLEITESALMANQEHAVEMLNQLHQLGIRLAIDDFGTGYSSLAYLKRFPLDILKIDKRFVDEITNIDDDLDIASTIITMGHILGYKILAEGVETEEQLNFLREKGCDVYQGYIKSRPVSADAFVELIKIEHID
ncbi:MAG: EAL domain-containing protein, partial [Methylococcales bacterium]